MRTLGPQSISSQGESLSHLVLSKNELLEVPSEALRQLRNLDHLNLNENNITALRRDAFIGLSKVCIPLEKHMTYALYIRNVQVLHYRAISVLKAGVTAKLSYVSDTAAESRMKGFF